MGSFSADSIKSTGFLGYLVPAGKVDRSEKAKAKVTNKFVDGKKEFERLVKQAKARKNLPMGGGYMVPVTPEELAKRKARRKMMEEVLGDKKGLDKLIKLSGTRKNLPMGGGYMVPVTPNDRTKMASEKEIRKYFGNMH